MRCSVCDEVIPEGSLFCPNCGTRVAAPANTGETVASPAVAPPSTAQPLRQPYDTPTAPQWSAPAQPQWVTAPNYTQTAAVPNSTTAVVSLIFGILSWVALPVIGPIVAVIAGHMARGEIRRSNGMVGGGGMATAGLILGYLQFALLLLAICAIVGLGLLALVGSSAP
jgi:hypothetical protein